MKKIIACRETTSAIPPQVLSYASGLAGLFLYSYSSGVKFHYFDHLLMGAGGGALLDFALFRHLPVVERIPQTFFLSCGAAVTMMGAQFTSEPYSPGWTGAGALGYLVSKILLRLPSMMNPPSAQDVIEDEAELERVLNRQNQLNDLISPLRDVFGLQWTHEEDSSRLDFSPEAPLKTAGGIRFSPHDIYVLLRHQLSVQFYGRSIIIWPDTEIPEGASAKALNTVLSKRIQQLENNEQLFRENVDQLTDRIAALTKSNVAVQTHFEPKEINADHVERVCKLSINPEETQRFLGLVMQYNQSVDHYSRLIQTTPVSREINYVGELRDLQSKAASVDAFKILTEPLREKLRVAERAIADYPTQIQDLEKKIRKIKNDLEAFAKSIGDAKRNLEQKKKDAALQAFMAAQPTNHMVSPAPVTQPNRGEFEKKHSRFLFTLAAAQQKLDSVFDAKLDRTRIAGNDHPQAKALCVLDDMVRDVERLKKEAIVLSKATELQAYQFEKFNLCAETLESKANALMEALEAIDTHQVAALLLHRNRPSFVPRACGLPTKQVELSLTDGTPFRPDVRLPNTAASSSAFSSRVPLAGAAQVVRDNLDRLQTAITIKKENAEWITDGMIRDVILYSLLRVGHSLDAKHLRTAALENPVVVNTLDLKSLRTYVAEMKGDQLPELPLANRASDGQTSRELWLTALRGRRDLLRSCQIAILQLRQKADDQKNPGDYLVDTHPWLFEAMKMALAVIGMAYRELLDGNEPMRQRIEKIFEAFPELWDRRPKKIVPDAEGQPKEIQSSTGQPMVLSIRDTVAHYVPDRETAMKVTRDDIPNGIIKEIVMNPAILDTLDQMISLFSIPYRRG